MPCSSDKEEEQQRRPDAEKEAAVTQKGQQMSEKQYTFISGLVG